MAESVPDPASVDAVRFAIRQFVTRPGVSLLDGPTPAGGGFVADFGFDVSLGTRWRARATDPKKVLAREIVRVSFPAGFPAKPVELSLRPDFNRAQPHVQPWVTAEKRVVPCVVHGSLAEFVAVSGFYSLADQMMVWLEKAATGTLIDPRQGWEPARRDDVADFLVVDPDSLAAVVADNGGFQFFTTEYGCERSRDLTPFFYGQLGERCTVKTELSETGMRHAPGYAVGKGMALALWAGRDAKRKPLVCDEYLPDDIETVGELRKRLERYGVASELQNALALIRHRCSEYRKGDPFPLIVIVLVRRPQPLIGTNSPIEALSYLVPLACPEGAMTDDTSPIRLVGHLESITPSILRALSGAAPFRPWALLGCGSLGSKVALHMARSANPPAMVADKSSLRPHNAARHGLYPQGEGITSNWLRNKAPELAGALVAFGKVDAVAGDHVALAEALRAIRGKSRPRWLVNTTASTVAREALCGPEFGDLPRMVEMTLYDAGSVGVVSIEGAKRNPDGSESIASLYQAATTDAMLRERLLKKEQLARVNTGQGCGSTTMVMSDARLSAMAAPMSELLAEFKDSTPAGVHIFTRDGLDLGHRLIETEPFTRVPVDGLAGWTMSVSASVAARIADDMGRHPRSETGGVLIGWSSMLAQRIVVTDLIAAPSDSKRSAAKFVLGTEGLIERFVELEEASAGLINFVGTWHSHLGSSEPSGLDKMSAALVAAGDPRPIAFLIVGTDGMRAIARPPTDLVYEIAREA